MACKLYCQWICEFFSKEDTGSIGSEGIRDFKLVLTYKEELPDAIQANNLTAVFDNGMEEKRV